MVPNRLVHYEGKAFASSVLNSYGRTAMHAFRPQGVVPWSSAMDQAPPHYVWFQFQQPKTLTKIGFSTRTEGRLFDQAPLKFDVVAAASAEGCGVDFKSKARILLSIEKAGFQKGNQARSWVIPTEIRAPYLCMGIKIHSSLGNSGHVSLHNTIMWESRVQQ